MTAAMRDDTSADGRITLIEYSFMALSWAAWGFLFLGYISAAIWVLVRFGSHPGAEKVEVALCVLSLIPLAGLGFSFLPIWLHRHGQRGPAMGVWALSLVLWLPVAVWTARVGVL